MDFFFQTVTKLFFFYFIHLIILTRRILFTKGSTIAINSSHIKEKEVSGIMQFFMYFYLIPVRLGPL